MLLQSDPPAESRHACSATPASMSGDDSDDGSSGDDAFADLTESDLALVDDLQNAVESQPGDYTAHSNVRASLPPLSRRALTPLCTHSWWRPSGAAPCGAGCTTPASPCLSASR